MMLEDIRKCKLMLRELSLPYKERLICGESQQNGQMARTVQSLQKSAKSFFFLRL